MAARGTLGGMSDVAEWWEAFYVEGRGRWSGKVNAALVEEAEGLEPGRALELGCGQGADAIWLAARGWEVVATDVSAAALTKADEEARAAGVDVVWERRDLAEGLPDGPFDLVTTAFLHSPVELPRAEILRAAAERVAPGGTLLVIGHAPSEEHAHHDLQTADETLAELALPDDEWRVVTNALRERTHTFAGEERAHARVDAILRLERRPAAG